MSSFPERDGTAAIELEVVIQMRSLMSDHHVSLDTLYARFDAIARRGAPGNSQAAHDAVQVRLAANRTVAAANGWTSLSVERAGGMGRLRLWGVPPSREDREIVPDWLPDEE